MTRPSVFLVIVFPFKSKMISLSRAILYCSFNVTSLINRKWPDAYGKVASPSHILHVTTWPQCSQYLSGETPVRISSRSTIKISVIAPLSLLKALIQSISCKSSSTPNGSTVPVTFQILDSALSLKETSTSAPVNEEFVTTTLSFIV